MVKYSFTLVAWLFIVACSNGEVENSQQLPPSENDAVRFAQTNEDVRWGEESRMIGSLSLVENCLSIKSDMIERVVIWPPEIEFVEDAETVTLLNKQTGEIINVGDVIALGGGEIYRQQVAEFVQDEAQLAGCPEPFFIAGSVNRYEQ